MANRVFVGLSGGVDSAVSAALLKERGYDVVGAFIKIWQPEFTECTWKEDRLDAMRVCVALGIPFKEVDLSDEYKREVVETMIADYERGITPNPDVLCNRSIKFGHFADWAFQNGADYVATGHYARIEKRDGKFALLRGKDPNKDQCYFLYQLTPHDLSHTLFPVGELTKDHVRAHAKRFGLPNAEKPDSQGLCFVGDVSIEDFLARFIPLERGPVLDTGGKTIGEHSGAALYTIGQRHGFIVHDSHGGEPHYVVSVDVQTNTIQVSPHRAHAQRKEASIENVHWIGKKPQFPCEAEAQARYRETPARVHLDEKGKNSHITFEKPHLLSPGQSLVVYQEDRVLGGGTISPFQTKKERDTISQW